VTKRTAEVKPTPVPSKVTPTPPPASNIKPAACYKGGCSGQICADREDMMSTCIFREEYACYQSATCERQANGDCGWTPTAELQACLSTTRSTTDPVY
jgi:eight-cysteine-cluster-containing protein